MEDFINELGGESFTRNKRRSELIKACVEAGKELEIRIPIGLDNSYQFCYADEFVFEKEADKK